MWKFGNVAELLGWKLWDQELIAEIACLSHTTPEAVERHEWRSDPKIHRLIGSGTPQDEAITQVDTIERDRAAFV